MLAETYYLGETLIESMYLRVYRRALSLSYFTVGYNIVEGIVSIFAGVLAGSIALVGFGLDSFVESLSGGVMICVSFMELLPKCINDIGEAWGVSLLML